MDNATNTLALSYADAIESGDENAITDAATALSEALLYDDSGDDFARAVLTAAVEEEPFSFGQVAAVIRALIS